MRIRLSQHFFMAVSKAIAVMMLCLFAASVHGQGRGMDDYGDYGDGMGMGEGMMDGLMGRPAPLPLELAKGELGAAKNDGQRQAAIKKIKTELTSNYDQFLKQNERQLQQMKDRLERLNAQLKRRKVAKGKLVDLELQRIVNEADGLVWPAEQANGTGRGGFDDGMEGDEYDSGGGMDEMEDDYGSYSPPTPVVPKQPQAGPAIKKYETIFTEKANSRTRLILMVLACLNYESTYRQLPTNITDSDGKPLLSWRVAILPMLGKADLYNKFHLDEPWDSEHNIKLLDQMPEPKTTLLGFDGPATIFENGQVLTFPKISDGSSNTIALALAKDDAAVPWSKPADIKFTPGKKVTELAVTNNEEYTFALADGSSHLIPADNLSQQQLENLIQCRDGNIAPNLHSRGSKSPPK